jgi:sugar/nucleoside kinase (ribokinase family)
MTLLRAVNGDELKFQRIIGTGGIGSGMFFKFDANHTLGRNESRSGELMQFKDYCKLHIIMHYMAVLLGGGSESGLDIYPMAIVGNDEVGRSLIQEIRNTGISVQYIKTAAEAGTLFSVCFQYPDSTGGNITTSNSASSLLTPLDIDGFFNTMPVDEISELMLAAPEVPLDARIRLLEYGRARGSFNVSAVSSSEVSGFKNYGGFAKTDFLSVNIDEARTIAGIKDETTAAVDIARCCIRVLSEENPNILVTVTNGPFGSYAWKNGCQEFIHPLKTKAIGTGGAGDAFLSGVISGMCCGLPFLKGRNDEFFSETPMKSAVELGTLLASLSVTSPDTIHREVDAHLLFEYAVNKKVQMSGEVLSIFGIDKMMEE